MARSDSRSDDESPMTDGSPTAAAFPDSILERMAQQDAAQKATNEQLAAIAAILAPLAGNSGIRPRQSENSCSTLTEQPPPKTR
ncbi:hypothetical protein Bca4012_072897 [Brassica carinata]|uniref:Uncharacterized protein n=1 Tax=Brassica carinata TaxID=52824 RepID=A0A8X7QJ23_BRACI|nr:hypothetical protein Bca52824_065238 [Brassica carinata]